MKTNKIKKVLIALDYDPTAQKVADIGFSLAKTMDAEVILLHVIADVTYYSALEYSQVEGFQGYMDMGSFQSDSMKKTAEHFLEKVKTHLGDKSIKTIAKEGDFADSILKTAKDQHVDLIVIGSHSRRWLENIIMGSVTEEVLRHTTIPLFIIPTKKHK
ncbi:MAG: universal stress protein [Bacteroidales bacterium]|nr:MAG: universal stress protein [Bacteroidales bacterium]